MRSASKYKFNIENNKIFQHCFIGFLCAICSIYSYHLSRWVLGGVDIAAGDIFVAGLMGRDMAAGNIFLSGWSSSTQFYYTTDILLSGFISLFVSSMENAVHICNAIISTFFFIAAFCAANTAIDGRYRVYYAMTALLSLHLVIVSYMLPNISIAIMHHNATIIMSAFAAVLYYKNGLKRWGEAIPFVILASFAFAGDKYAIVYLAIPLVLENIVTFFTKKKIDKEILLLPVAAVLAYAICKFLTLQGFKTPLAYPSRFASWEELVRNFHALLPSLFGVFNVDIWGKLPGKDSLRGCLFLLFLFVSAYLHFFVLLKRRNNRIVFFLALSSICIVCGGVFSVTPATYFNAQHLRGLRFNSLILLISFVFSTGIFTRFFTICIIALSALIFAIYPIKLPRENVSALIKKLDALGLQTGYSTFDLSRVLTLRSENRLQIAAVAAYHNNTLIVHQSLQKEIDASAYFNFLVVKDSLPKVGGSYKHFDEDSLIAQYGKPQRIEFSPGYKIYIWDRNIALPPTAMTYSGYFAIPGNGGFVDGKKLLVDSSVLSKLKREKVFEFDTKILPLGLWSVTFDFEVLQHPDGLDGNERTWLIRAETFSGIPLVEKEFSVTELMADCSVLVDVTRDYTRLKFSVYAQKGRHVYLARFNKADFILEKAYGGFFSYQISNVLTDKEPITLQLPKELFLFVDDRKFLSGISLRIGTYDRVNPGKAELILHNEHGQKIIREIDLPSVQNNHYHYFELEPDCYVRGEIKASTGGGIVLWETRLSNGDVYSCAHYSFTDGSRVNTYGCPN